MLYRNPIVRGFYPDPSVCRVGEDYYLVNSTFEYFPGVPIFHSRDLIHWQQIGHCLTRSSQLPLAGCGTSGGVYAPTLRFHDGRFYMVTTILGKMGHFLVHTNDPAGDWSEPVLIDGGSIDPSLFFDEDGKVYFTWADQAIRQVEIDAATGQHVSEQRVIWHGTGDRATEGPHLYRIGDTYYLLAAEGGTEYAHTVVVGRSNSPWGPWEPCPHNPILTHRGVDSPIQCTGHGDLIQAHDGSWWMVFLGVRAVGYPPTYHLGRETLLTPVSWDDGWPVVNGGRPVQLEMDVPTLPSHPWPPLPPRDEFDSDTFDPRWNWLRNPHTQNYSLTARPGWLRLIGTDVSLDTNGASPTWIGRRQQDLNCRAETLLEFEPTAENEQAGLTVWMNCRHHYDLFVTRRDDKRVAVVRRRIGSLHAETGCLDLPTAGPVRLIVHADAKHYRFQAAGGSGQPIDIDTGECRYLSTECAGGFTGVYITLFASGNGQACQAAADVDYFDLQPTDRP